jgi:twitching motility two-component system response regulator PilG
MLGPRFLRAGSQSARRAQRYHTALASIHAVQAAANVRNFLPRATPLVDGRHHANMLKGCVELDVARPWGRERPLGPLGRRRNVSGGSNAAKPKNDLQGLKILVIDDSKTIRRTAETLLAKEGCEVFTAVDGFDALSKIADHRPDIIFVDIMMPRLDGYQTCSLIKHNRVFKDTPVIMLSSKDGLFDRARGRLVGSEQYLTKPFTKDELLGAIQSHVVK